MSKRTSAARVPPAKKATLTAASTATVAPSSDTAADPAAVFDVAPLDTCMQMLKQEGAATMLCKVVASPVVSQQRKAAILRALGDASVQRLWDYAITSIDTSVITSLSACGFASANRILACIRIADWPLCITVISNAVQSGTLASATDIVMLLGALIPARGYLKEPINLPVVEAVLAACTGPVETLLGVKVDPNGKSFLYKLVAHEYLDGLEFLTTHGKFPRSALKMHDNIVQSLLDEHYFQKCCGDLLDAFDFKVEWCRKLLSNRNLDASVSRKLSTVVKLAELEQEMLKPAAITPGPAL